MDSMFAVPGTFLSKELFYIMATRHRWRLSIHMLESDRTILLAKASLNIARLHGSDLISIGRAGVDWSLELTRRLQAPTDRLFALMQKERGRFEAVIAGSVRMATQLPMVQTGLRSIHNVGSTLERILSRASALQRKVARLIGGARHREQLKHQPEQQVQPEQLAQFR